MSVNFEKYYGKISNSGGDEHGHANGGKAGDQTGTEWRIRSWYSRPWNCVLRYPNQKARQLIAELSIEAAQNNKIGYDQYQRNTYWTQLQKAGYRPSKIKTACEADCSAGVIANTKAAGHLLNINALKNVNASYTGNLKSGLKAAGFQVLTDKKYLTGYDYLVPGDILLYEGHHTATNLGIGKKSGYKKTAAASATSSSHTYNKTKKRTGTVTAGELYVRQGPGKSYEPLKSYPTIKKGTKVGICDEDTAKDKTKWYYVIISGNKGDKYGFVSAKYIK